jgi:hypothetical protein
MLWTTLEIGLEATMTFNRYDRPGIKFTWLQLFTASRTVGSNRPKCQITAQ